MPRIAVLPPTVVDQIAAGEVIERPASVVKELLENALDAGARSIDIDITDGGRARIRVADDGLGMTRDDAVLALARHATSKIRRTDDLVGVTTFGFRGEALAAIASVCAIEIETAAEDGAGTLVLAECGEIREVTSCSRRRGTTVTVSRLFANAPSRLAFLRSPRSEWRAIGEALTSIALTRRDVRLTATHDGRQAFALAPASSLRARAAALWGGVHADALVDVDDVSGPIHVSGLIERPGDAGTAARRIFLSVNGRAVRDHGIVRAAEAAYRSTIPAGVRPSLLLELTVPGDLVDVNVHPMKVEVRFRDRWPLERAVESAVRRALGAPASAPAMGYRAWSSFGGAGGVAAVAPVDTELLRRADDGLGPLLDDANGQSRDTIPVPDGTSVPPLVQLRDTYLMFEHEGGLVLIDQHSAHERVLFERFLGTLERGEAPSQRLLFPMTLHLGPAEADAFEEHQDLFAALGFEVEGFGGHTLIVRAVPMPHPRFDAERCIRETLDALAGSRLASAAPRHERLAATVACKAAIKAGDSLSPGEMRALYTALSATTLPAHDVHGRATIVHVPWDEVDRRFGRR
ncbi:MAG TPA: DNA mismatch repair endonuclease MutL [Gemmatimonadaceae bacterium]|nr:DNA mismatch repair endonuclease MutL [Gemmatimonadaceae bacterium]